MIRIGAMLACLLLGGCVERLVMVRSDPPGAIVRMDDEEVGRTPCEVEYTWYGTREIAVELPGHRSVRRLVDLPPPWWQVFPFDLITDVVLPFTIRDQRNLGCTLPPEPANPEGAKGVLIGAAELRRSLDFPEK